MGGRVKIRDINAAPGARQEASGATDVFGGGGGEAGAPTFQGGTWGSIAYRGAVKWDILGPSTSGFALTTNGGGANPSWTKVVTNLVGRASGAIATIESAFDNPTVGVDGNAQEGVTTSEFGTVVT